MAVSPLLRPSFQQLMGCSRLSSMLKGQRRLSARRVVSQFRRLQRKGPFAIDSYSILGLLRHTHASSRNEGKQIHAVIIRLGFEHIVFLQTALMGLYSKAGNLSDAYRVFNEMPQRTVVCWTALISAFLNNGQPNRALELFRQMQVKGVEPDLVTVTTALSACADLGALDVGKWIHAYVNRKQMIGEDLILRNALINMYAKCGDIEAAQRLFDTVTLRDVTTWTSIIMGHALHGRPEEALWLFAKMEEHQSRSSGSCLIVPNGVTFIGVLMACSHAGLVEEGRKQWERMVRVYDLRPQMAHYGCMVDLFCRAGLLFEAQAFIEEMPIRPSAVIWRTLLGACKLHGNINLGAQARRKLLELEPYYAGDDIAMSNAYAAAELWVEKQGAREASEKQRRVPGCSLIELGSTVHGFVASDRKRVTKWEIRDVIKGLVANLRGLERGLDSSSLVDCDDPPE